MESSDVVLTGDHDLENANSASRPRAESLIADKVNISPVETRSSLSEKDKIMDALPKDTKERLKPTVSIFSGFMGEEAEMWLEKTEKFAKFNEFSMSNVFGFLLVEDAKILWDQHIDGKRLKDDDCIRWFKEKFIVKKRLMNLFEDLVNVEQNEGEKFETFSIRISSLVDKVLNASISKDELVKELLSTKSRSEKLKENFALKSEMTIDEMKKMAETVEHSFDNTKKVSYAAVIARSPCCHNSNKQNRNFNAGTLPHKENYSNNYKQSGNNSRNQYAGTRRNDDITQNKYADRRQNVGTNRSDNRKQNTYEDRSWPKYSMKYRARVAYNRAVGKPDPVPVELKKGDCFCCGSHGHIKNNCPMKDKCLICGKSGHYFHRCFKLGNHRVSVIEENNIQSILEDEEVSEDVGSSDILHHDLKNAVAPAAHISTVGSAM